MSEPSTLKFICTTKYDTAMFEVVQISPSQKTFFNIKPYKDRQYAYIPMRKIKCDNKFIKNYIFTVDNVESWIYKKNGNEYNCMKYHLKLKKNSNKTKYVKDNKRQSKCLFS